MLCSRYVLVSQILWIFGFVTNAIELYRVHAILLGTGKIAISVGTFIPASLGTGFKVSGISFTKKFARKYR